MEEKKPLGLLFKQIHIAFENNLQREAANQDLTPAQVDILVYLFRNSGHAVNQKELERHLQLSNPTVTGILNRMEAKGFIRRVASAEDGRVRFIEPTEKAYECDVELRRNIDRMEKRIVQHLSTQEQEQLYGLLTLVLKGAN